MKRVMWIMIIEAMNLFGFEVNTHQALTRCAITNNCENSYAKNLFEFVNHAEIQSQSYTNEIFEGYGIKYIQYVKAKDTGFEDWKINITNPNYLGMIEAGSVLEDALYPEHDFSGDGRFNNHFYAAQFNSKKHCPLVTGYMRTSKALCIGYGFRTDNIDWVLNDKVSVNHNNKNAYGLHDAFTYFKNSFKGSAAERRKNQAKLFVTLGHIVHMLQDLHSPAHCRDNSHAKGDYLEIYGRYNGGFNLVNGSFNSANNPRIVNAVKAYGSSRYLLSQNRYYTYEDFFKKEATWVSNNFASESHLHLGFENIDPATGEGLIAGNLFDSTSLFDERNIHPSKSETFESGKFGSSYQWAYVYTEGNTVSGYVNGPIPSDARRISLVHKGWLFDSYHMIAPHYTWIQGGTALKEVGLNKQPLEDTAVNVMPRAVASTQAFIDYFFRGQMEATLDENGKMKIVNVSKADTLSDPSLATFKKGGKFRLYYDNNGVYSRFSTWTLGNDLPIGSHTYLAMGTKVFKDKPKGTKIVVLFDGYIGDNKGGNNSYGIGTRGLSVDMTTVPYMPDNQERYSVKLVQTSKPLVDKWHPVGSWSYAVKVYKNDSLYKQVSLNNLLRVQWYDGSAHFNNSYAHHYDIWCQGNTTLCNYLRTTVPRDSSKPYQGWHIDWTIWQANLGRFSTNAFNMIKRYYESQYRSSSNKSLRSAARQDAVVANDTLYRDDLDSTVSLDENYTSPTYQNEEDGSVETYAPETVEENEEQIDAEQEETPDLTQEEQAEMEKIAQEERGE